MQFISLENTELIQRTYSLLEKQSEDLLNHLIALRGAQRSSHWMLEQRQIQRAHHHFRRLKQRQVQSSPNVLN